MKQINLSPWSAIVAGYVFFALEGVKGDIEKIDAVYIDSILDTYSFAQARDKATVTLAQRVYAKNGKRFEKVG